MRGSDYLNGKGKREGQGDGGEGRGRGEDEEGRGRRCEEVEGVRKGENRNEGKQEDKDNITYRYLVEILLNEYYFNIMTNKFISS